MVLLALPAIACWLLGHGPFGYGVTATAIFMVGFAAGVEYDLLAFLTARYFGMKSYGIIYGALYSFFSFGAGVGPAIFGTAFDKSHSYIAPLTVAAFAIIGGGVMLLGLGRYRDFEQPSGGVILTEAEMTFDTRSV